MVSTRGPHDCWLDVGITVSRLIREERERENEERDVTEREREKQRMCVTHILVLKVLRTTDPLVISCASWRM